MTELEGFLQRVEERLVATVGAALDTAYVDRWVKELELEDEWEAAKRTR